MLSLNTEIESDINNNAIACTMGNAIWIPNCFS